MEIIRKRVADESFMRLIGKCLHVGVLDGEEFEEPDEGTTQGSIVSPILGNIYLHHVLDRWFETEVKPNLKGSAHLIRYADDFVMGFKSKKDAEHVMELLTTRMSEYGLKLHPEKTRLIPIARPAKGASGGKGPGTFDFLGFTVYWTRTRRGYWSLRMRTRKARFRRALEALGEYCRRHRHDPLKEQHAALTRRLQGHFNYFGVNGNIDVLRQLVRKTERLWCKWLRRRSQKHRLSWERFWDFLKVYPLPKPSIRVQVWAT